MQITARDAIAILTVLAMIQMAAHAFNAVNHSVVAQLAPSVSAPKSEASKPLKVRRAMKTPRFRKSPFRWRWLSPPQVIDSKSATGFGQSSSTPANRKRNALRLEFQ